MRQWSAAFSNERSRQSPLLPPSGSTAGGGSPSVVFTKNVNVTGTVAVEKVVVFGTQRIGAATRFVARAPGLRCFRLDFFQV